MPWSCTKRYMCSVHGMSRAVESPGAAPEQPSWAPNGKPREGDARAPVGRFHGHSGHPMELMHPPARGPQWEPSKRSAQDTPLLPQPAASTLSNLGPNPHRSAVNPPPPAPSTKHHRNNHRAEAAAFPHQRGDGRRGCPSSRGGGGILAERTRRCCRFRSCVPGTPRSIGAGGFLREQLVIKAPSTARGFRGEAGGER